VKLTNKVLPVLLVLALVVAFASTRRAIGTEDSRESPLYESTLRQAYSEMRTLRVEAEPEPEATEPVILTNPRRKPNARLSEPSVRSSQTLLNAQRRRRSVP